LCSKLMNIAPSILCSYVQATSFLEPLNLCSCTRQVHRDELQCPAIPQCTSKSNSSDTVASGQGDGRIKSCRVAEITHFALRAVHQHNTAMRPILSVRRLIRSSQTRSIVH
jgi:hypothetical protein